MTEEELQALRDKYGERRIPPDPDCHKCGGAGEYLFHDPNNVVQDHTTPCACIFFPKEDRGWITEMISDVAKRELKKLHGE